MKILQHSHSQACQHGEFRHVSVSEGQRSTVWSESLWGFCESCTGNESRTIIIGGLQYDKSTCISTTKVSLAPIVRLGHAVHDSDQDGVVRIFPMTLSIICIDYLSRGNRTPGKRLHAICWSHKLSSSNSS